MKLQLRFGSKKNYFTVINLEILTNSFVLDLLEYKEVSLLSILINKSYQRFEILTFGINK